MTVSSRSIFGTPFMLGISLASMLALAAPGLCKTYCVDAAASTDNAAADGDHLDPCWQNAFSNLQDAFDVAEDGDSVMVAAGVYYPTTSFDPATGKPRPTPKPGSPAVDYSPTFSVTTDITVIGGYPSRPSASSERDWLTHRTILSGDVGMDDDTVAGITQSYTDIKAINANTVLINTAGGAAFDGLIFTAGDDQYYFQAGGVYNTNRSGAGVIAPVFRNCSFIGNRSLNRGGGMNNVNGTTVGIANSVFNNNGAHQGAAIAATGSYGTMSISHTSFSGNASTGNGSALWLNDQGSGVQGVTIEHASFSGNSAGSDMGAGHPNDLIELATRYYGPGDTNPSQVTLSYSVVLDGGAQPFSASQGDMIVNAVHLVSTDLQGVTACPYSTICDAATRAMFASGDAAADGEAKTRPNPRVEAKIGRLGPQKPHPFRDQRRP